MFLKDTTLSLPGVFPLFIAKNVPMAPPAKNAKIGSRFPFKIEFTLMVTPINHAILIPELDSIAFAVFPFETALILMVLRYRKTISEKKTINACNSTDKYSMLISLIHYIFGNLSFHAF